MTLRLRVTPHVQAVLGVLLADPNVERYGGEIAEATGMLPGTAYPILHRLIELGWIADRWEDGDPRTVARPLRRFYRLTGSGVTAARAALATARRLRLL